MRVRIPNRFATHTFMTHATLCAARRRQTRVCVCSGKNVEQARTCTRQHGTGRAREWLEAVLKRRRCVAFLCARSHSRRRQRLSGKPKSRVTHAAGVFRLRTASHRVCVMMSKNTCVGWGRAFSGSPINTNSIDVKHQSRSQRLCVCVIVIITNLMLLGAIHSILYTVVMAIRGVSILINSLCYYGRDTRGGQIRILKVCSERHEVEHRTMARAVRQNRHDTALITRFTPSARVQPDPDTLKYSKYSNCIRFK